MTSAPAAWTATLVSVAAVSAIPLIAVAVLAGRAHRHTATLYLTSFAIGALLGTAFIHLIPEAYATLGAGPRVPMLVLGGFFGFFVLEKFLWAHSSHSDSAGGSRMPTLATLNLVGDGVHNFVDGMVVAAAYTASGTLGIATTVAVVLHEVPQELGDVGVLLFAGLPIRRVALYNFVSGLTAFAGALAVLIVGNAMVGLARILVPVAAGSFIYIAAADLVPALQPTRSGATALRQVLLAALGAMVMLALRLLG